MTHCLFGFVGIYYLIEKYYISTFFRVEVWDQCALILFLMDSKSKGKQQNGPSIFLQYEWYKKNMSAKPPTLPESFGEIRSQFLKIVHIFEFIHLAYVLILCWWTLIHSEYWAVYFWLESLNVSHIHFERYHANARARFFTYWNISKEFKSQENRYTSIQSSVYRLS